MKRIVKWIVIVLVVLSGFTYAMYAWDYQGNYNLSVTVPVHGGGDGTTVSASSITTESSPTSIWQFWSSLSGASGTGTGLYAVYCELNYGDSVQHRAFDIVSGQDLSFTFEFKNVEPGQANIHVYIMDQTLSTKLYDHNWGVTVG
jgi:hypothetical protein